MLLLFQEVQFFPQTLADWGTVCAGTGTFISAIALGFTLIQLKRQIDEQEIRLRPWLNIVNVIAKLEKDRNGNEVFNVCMKMKNFGESPAINITHYSMGISIPESANTLPSEMNEFRANIKKKNYDHITVSKLGVLMPDQEQEFFSVLSKEIYDTALVKKQTKLPDGTILKFDGNLYTFVFIEYTFARTKKSDSFDEILVIGPEGYITTIKNLDYIPYFCQFNQH